MSFSQGSKHLKYSHWSDIDLYLPWSESTLSHWCSWEQVLNCQILIVAEFDTPKPLAWLRETVFKSNLGLNSLPLHPTSPSVSLSFIHIGLAGVTSETGVTVQQYLAFGISSHFPLSFQLQKDPEVTALQASGSIIKLAEEQASTYLPKILLFEYQIIHSFLTCILLRE